MLVWLKEGKINNNKQQLSCVGVSEFAESLDRSSPAPRRNSRRSSFDAEATTIVRGALLRGAGGF
jgi:hypothetical protein